MTDDIPMPPQVVQKVATEMKLRRQAMIFGNCRTAAWAGKFPLWYAPEALGAAIADNLLNQIMQRLAAKQSRLVAAQSKLILPRRSP